MNRDSQIVTVGVLAGFNLIVVHMKNLNILITMLAVMMIVDYLTGVTNSILKGENFDIVKAIKGILKKINYIYIILSCVIFDIVLKNSYNLDMNLSYFICGWLILNEIISTLSNITNNKILPKNLIEYIKKIREGLFNE